MFSPNSKIEINTRLLEFHFLVSGLIIWLVFLLLLFHQDVLLVHYFSPKLLSITHLIVLGSITLIIMGVLSQMLPFFIQAKLYSAEMVKYSSLAVLVGAILIAFAFWNFYVGVHLVAGGGLVLVGVLLFSLNIIFSIHRSGQTDIGAIFISTSVYWLMFTVLLGVLLAINFTNPYIAKPHSDMLKIHSHAGLIGFVVQMVMGVGTKLFPMFMVAHGFDTKMLKPCFYLFNISIVVALGATYSELPVLFYLSVAGVFASSLLYGIYLRGVFLHRVRKQLDTGMKQTGISILAVPVLIMPLFLFLISSSNNPAFHSTAYMVTLIGGLIISIIMGQTYKILPYAVWIRKYKKELGQITTVFPRDLLPVQWAKLQGLLFFISVATMALAIIVQQFHLLRIGLAVGVASVLMYVIIMFKISFLQPSNQKVNDA